ncbi:unnamed protein product [Sphagnum troendelagicum]|uniref:Uncharacterized protein n=1 Tax=Sphagnum troendelagicum TaxID=128251 RepID=A0ABP0TE84_9BRYO
MYLALQAKELRRVADNMVQLGKQGTLAARQGDAAAMAFIEFVDPPNELRESKPPWSPPPLRLPLPPWLQSRHARQWAPMRSGLQKKITWHRMMTFCLLCVFLLSNSCFTQLVYVLWCGAVYNVCLR